MLAISMSQAHQTRSCPRACKPCSASHFSSSGLITFSHWPPPKRTHDVADALRRIEQAALIADKQPLRLLALRRYLRLQDRDHVDLHSIWSWTEDQVQQSLQNGTARDLMVEAERVQATSARNNPGYTLTLSPPRSLARQVRLWVGSDSARLSAAALWRTAVRELDDARYALPAHITRVQAFAAWVRKRAVIQEPGNAAPGTSDHGQMRAIDFIVMRGRNVVAGTSRASIPAVWTEAGWARRLEEATAGTRLSGPLRTPYEPWHWSLE